MYSPLASKRATRELLASYGLLPRRAYGQNFLVDDNIVAKILQLASLDGARAQDGASCQRSCVLEIGPGIGTLSLALLEYVDLIAIERDIRLVPVLTSVCARWREHFLLIKKDALKCCAKELETARLRAGFVQPHMLVANLPYSSAATLILDWFERFEFIETMVVMVHSELAKRISASPGNKNYGAYTVKLSLYARQNGSFAVPHSCFYPVPHVESSVVRLERVCQTEDAPLVASACLLADAAFAQRRKTVRNSMKSFLSSAQVDELLSKAKIDPDLRAEMLKPRDFLAMAAAF